MLHYAEREQPREILVVFQREGISGRECKNNWEVSPPHATREDLPNCVAIYKSPFDKGGFRGNVKMFEDISPPPATIKKRGNPLGFPLW
jgi:hypothetical protein